MPRNVATHNMAIGKRGDDRRSSSAIYDHIGTSKDETLRPECSLTGERQRSEPPDPGAGA